MFDKLIAPFVVAIAVGFVLLWGNDIKELISPEKEVVVTKIRDGELLSSNDVGRRNFSIFQGEVSTVYLTQFRVENAGKKAIEKLELHFSINKQSNDESLFRVFYTTEPSKNFGQAKFKISPFESVDISVDKFINNNSLSVSIFSSSEIAAKPIINMAEVDFTYDEEPKEDKEDIIFVAIISALVVFIFRLLYDLVSWLWYRKRS